MPAISKFCIAAVAAQAINRRSAPSTDNKKEEAKQYTDDGTCVNCCAADITLGQAKIDLTHIKDPRAGKKDGKVAFVMFGGTTGGKAVNGVYNMEWGTSSFEVCDITQVESKSDAESDKCMKTEVDSPTDADPNAKLTVRATNVDTLYMATMYLDEDLSSDTFKAAWNKLKQSKDSRRYEASHKDEAQHIKRQGQSVEIKEIAEDKNCDKGCQAEHWGKLSSPGAWALRDILKSKEEGGADISINVNDSDLWTKLTEIKFSASTKTTKQVRDRLRDTKDTFLIYHLADEKLKNKGPETGDMSNMGYTDNHDGSGHNGWGLILMSIREKLLGSQTGWAPILKDAAAAAKEYSKSQQWSGADEWDAAVKEANTVGKEHVAKASQPCCGK